MLGEPFGNGSRHYHHRRGQRQAGLNYSCPASTIVCRQEARVPYLESGGVPPGWGLVGQEFEGGWGCDTVVTPPCLLGWLAGQPHST
jgi:hypothetical protein